MNRFTANLFKLLGVIVVLTSWFMSLWLMAGRSRNNPSAIIQLMFIGWVSSPFAGLLVAAFFSARWSEKIRIAFYGLMIAIPVGSWVAYSGAINITGTANAFMFLMVPLASWVAMAGVYLIFKKNN